MKLNDMHKLGLGAALVALLGGAGLATAQGAEYTGKDAHEVNALAKARIGLAEAVSIAERETSGKALEAQIEAKKNGTAYFEVEVFAAGQIQDVRIDLDGKVLSVQPD